PDGRSRAGIPLGPRRPCRARGTASEPLVRDRPRHAGRRPRVLQAHRKHLRRRGMSDTAIRVAGISKQYRLGQIQAYGTLRDSIGMAVRLAFSVGAHLETEIILVDEVLSVGDVEFQRKCLGKMEDVTSEGRTVVFVSHNLTAVRRLCSRAILLKSGEVEADGP